MQQSPKVIAIANQKGGVGKTTTTEHLGIGLARQGKKVLLIDLDPQANLTSCLGWKNVDALDHTVSDIIEASIRKEPVVFNDIILHHDEGIDLIPSNIKLSEYEPRLAGVFMREKILANGLEPIKEDYDYILIDCSPTLGILTINAIVAADEILIPVQPQYLPAIGMTQLVRTIEEVRTNMKPDLKYSGIVFTLVNMQTNIAKDTIESVKETFGKHIKVYESYIPITRRRYLNTMGPYIAIEHEYDKGFYTDDRCIGCSTCEKVCPNQNITMSEKRPVWNHHCHGCNACVVYCPTKAIQFKTPKAYQELGTFISKILRLPEKRKRYHHPLIKACDLMKDGFVKKSV